VKKLVSQVIYYIEKGKLM